MRTILIAGLGLIGGSAGKALRRRGWFVRYVDPHVSLDDARAAGAANERVENLGDIGNTDLVLLATPVDVAVQQLSMIATDATITSACSVMRPLRAVARENFIAGHPLAGSHERGLAAASAELFEQKAWFVDGDHELVDALIRDCGAIRERVTSAEEHDAAVALTSHLPQVLSTALAAHLHAQGDDVLRFAGTGLKTFLRLAASSAEVWEPVLEANRGEIEPHADAVAERVREILRGDAAELFEHAQQLWKKQ
ncbi:MAG TPA: prephenate dehydrogenase/arogenate dehydrogenase family protein [Thermoanaerobaculia bacterium]